MSNKQSQLYKIKEDIILKKICPDLARNAINLVMGDGNVDAEIVFIGEAPGRKEDETGMPFMGASGRFLNDMLESIELERSDVFITNIVKYRPPDNRDPLASEKAAFLPYLIKQILVINPKIIVTLGRHSMENFIPDAKISDIHGKPQIVNIDNNEIILVPLYHPAAAIYNRKLRQTLFDDFECIKQIVDDLSAV